MTRKAELLLVNSFHEETIIKLDALYSTHHLWELSSADKTRLLQSLNGRCKAAATGSWACDPAVFDIKGLELISCFGVGVDAIDFSLTNARNISVTDTPDVLNDAVADIAMALILCTGRNLINADNFVREQAWQTAAFPLGSSLANKTLGIVGLGRIGEAVVKRALPFKLKIAYHNRSPKQLPYSYYPTINELAEAADILLCTLPGGAATAKIIDAEVFRHLGSEGIFINVGRGSSVDEEALGRALHSGQIAAAGLDVYANEPQVAEVIRSAKNAVLLPHIGSGTVETRQAMGNLLRQNLQAYFAGEPLLTQVTKS